MFNKIIKASDGTVLALTEDVTYIKKADNGCYILCPEPDASGISPHIPHSFCTGNASPDCDNTGS